MTTMIEATTVYGLTAVVYAVALVVLWGWLRQVSPEHRRFCTPIVLVVALAGVASAVVAAGVGTITVNGSEVVVPLFVESMIAYGVLYAVMARLADVEGRALAAIVLTPVVQRIAFEVAAVSGGIVALIGLVVVVGGHLAIAAYLLGPVWTQTRGVPEQRRLLHWKARNLVLFLIGMLIAYAVIALFGVFDAFVSLAISQYMAVLIRVGFAGFLLANLDAVGSASLRPTTASETTPAD
ncbi:rhodopsin [Halomicrobium sp. ZPS1]|nr:rhodopsin [Halomicrobium mukohataei]QFR20492.1 rhodopsin [Halomicrobium sp. ZPS1]